MTTATVPSVLVMAKAPRPGTVKTRLHPLLGPAGCAALQAELIRHTLQTASSSGLAVHLAYAAGGDEGDNAAKSRDRADSFPLGLVPPGVSRLRQRGDHLGQRMTAATCDVLAAGAGRLLVIGTDAPTLTAGDLSAAATALDTHDVVLGPALDGGYYLIGMRSPHPEVFGIDPALWSTDQVLAATRARARELGLTVELLRPLRDLDTPQDAAAFLTEPALPKGIATALQAGERERV